MKRSHIVSVLLALCLGSMAVLARAGEVLRFEGREAVMVSGFWQPVEGASKTLLILPGGEGGFGRLDRQGWPTSRNFLVRTARLWVAQGFNVFIFGRPQDMPVLGWSERASSAHLQDLQAALAWLKTMSAAPIWVLGTSRGTVSAALLLAQASDPRLAGGVLSSSVVSQTQHGGLFSLELRRIKVPVLVYHHRDDACELCRPSDLPGLLAGLENAATKKLMLVTGGQNPSGKTCGSQHHHGYIGMEQQAVSDISAWIRDPQP